ncbi:RNA-binding domain-containing protein [Penicillium chermesinum]|uniref:RNA-binding domain-containing protein n=1 Tax=Penicillium chermesinum TaxID=63820 RepID=A0A9W9PHT1_9EURO|nr:RNA-binding domain-containing protein [Penicillium chermesinum]KAJ5246944.1 RNA-binding domain-containing protein [Penicillium chermesinum]
MSGARHWEQDKEATVYVGNLDERVTDSLVWELMLQVGRIVNVHLPKDRVTQLHQGYGFVEFTSEEDAEYASKIMNGIRLHGKPIRVNKASADKQKSVEIGAELFVGNLDPMVTEQILYDTFSRFGTPITLPKVIARDDNHVSKGYGFVSFGDFESSDAAIANMNGQYLMNKQVSVQYAYKKDGKGERHGDDAERLLAAQARKHNVQPLAQQAPSNAFTGPGFTPAGLPIPNGDTHRPVNAGSPAADLGMNRGLPARPPPSQAGYGGPQAFLAPGYNGAPQQPGFAPNTAHQAGFGPPGFAPPLPGHHLHCHLDSSSQDMEMLDEEHELE